VSWIGTASKAHCAKPQVRSRKPWAGQGHRGEDRRESPGSRRPSRRCCTDRHQGLTTANTDWHRGASGPLPQSASALSGGWARCWPSRRRRRGWTKARDSSDRHLLGAIVFTDHPDAGTHTSHPERVTGGITVAYAARYGLGLGGLGQGLHRQAGSRQPAPLGALPLAAFVCCRWPPPPSPCRPDPAVA